MDFHDDSDAPLAKRSSRHSFETHDRIINVKFLKELAGSVPFKASIPFKASVPFKAAAAIKTLAPVKTMSVNEEPNLKLTDKKRLTPFRLIKDLFKQGKAEEIYAWICNATASERQTAINYAINQFFDMDRIDLITMSFTYLNINFQTIENLEMGILLIRYYLHFNSHEEAMKVLTNLNAKSLIRKRHVELIVEYYQQKGFLLDAYDLFNTFYRDRFNITVEEVIPMLIPMLKPYIENHFIIKNVLSLINHKALYFPAKMAFEYNYEITSSPPADLIKIPIDLSEALSKIVPLLPYKKKFKTREEELASLLSSTSIQDSLSYTFNGVKYVIDGANVLFSESGCGKPQILYKMVQELALLGPVVVVLHQRHFNKGLVTRAHLNILNVQLCITPYGVNDDYYSLFVSMSNNAILITNDLFRDHIFKLDPVISLWHKEYVANYTNLKFPAYSCKINFPLTFSHRVQSTYDNFYLCTADPSEWIIIPVVH